MCIVYHFKNVTKCFREHISDVFAGIKWKYSQFQEHAFDRKFRLEAESETPEYLHAIGSRSVDFAIPYEAIQFDVFSRIMKDTSKLLEETRNYVFVDLGSGKGRALVYAARKSFMKCIGVEFSPTLHNIAERNIRAYCRNVPDPPEFELHCIDAIKFELPNANIVLFMYNPFVGEVMQSIVRKIERFVESDRYDLIVLYRNPTCADYFDNDFLTLIVDTHRYNIYRSAARAK